MDARRAVPGSADMDGRALKVDLLQANVDRLHRSKMYSMESPSTRLRIRTAIAEVSAPLRSRLFQLFACGMGRGLRSPPGTDRLAAHDKT
jgi:hypothetical protein